MWYVDIFNLGNIVAVLGIRTKTLSLGEMACSVPLINGISQEWALAKRHVSEDIFGVQLCGNSPQLVAYATQVVKENCEVDFIDLNLGCPIELIYGQVSFL